MALCDRCDGPIRDKYPWFSYFSPMGESSPILFRYCNECKIDMRGLYGIEEECFGRACSQSENEENIKLYFQTRGGQI